MTSPKQFVVAALFLAVPRIAVAGEPVDPVQLRRGPELGLRSGVGVFSHGTDFFDDQIEGMFPFWVDAGYRFLPALYVGVFFQAAPLILDGTEGACAHTLSCFGWDYRFGFNVLYHLSPRAPADPWIGGGFGYELYGYSARRAAGNVSTEENGRGPELFNLQMGLSFELGAHLRAGPFAAAALSRYVRITRTFPPDSVGSAPIHNWFWLGLQATFDP
jgi:hypothetical protein